MLKIDDVAYEYHNECFHFDATISSGDIVALMGPSGAGKSTLLALMAGFIEPQKGRILVEGKDVVGKVPSRRPFAMLFQEHNLFAHLSVRQNIGLGLEPSLKLSAEQQQQIDKAAKQVGIAQYLDRLPEQLSGGQRQRVALARCFVQPHKIWLLDEPFSALDPVLRAEMLDLVKALATENNITVLMVTHHLSDAKAIASHFMFMANGIIADNGVIGALQSNHHSTMLREFVSAAE
ncbi:thiamine ABC transporter ATP-binding protein [Vibrio caribbeanicus]|uniref:Putative thiamine ABC transporter, ATP-binding protein n=1 Tax=Vibrio caribbeanicus ATCC BAA-2122 TaxID=796620 RepID=E3BGE8_9VIBR|nr:thiamine ABC transporter ATP-binding protein [Vibrio caribbeanicus]EFP97891.1 putative thiamine ABC transporter, ATP-binding protein [Vibrio caribbeanicus ATCC BAA-2122]